MKPQISLMLLCFLLESCSNKMTLPGNTDIHLFTEKQKTENLNNIKIIYIIPKNINNKGDLDGLFLSSQQWGIDSKREKIISSFSDEEMKVERRVDNGVAGSGLIYSIDIKKTEKDGNKINKPKKLLHGINDERRNVGIKLFFPTFWNQLLTLRIPFHTDKTVWTTEQSKT